MTFCQPVPAQGFLLCPASLPIADCERINRYKARHVSSACRRLVRTRQRNLEDALYFPGIRLDLKRLWNTRHCKCLAKNNIAALFQIQRRWVNLQVGSDADALEL